MALAEGSPCQLTGATWDWDWWGLGGLEPQWRLVWARGAWVAVGRLVELG